MKGYSMRGFYKLSQVFTLFSNVRSHSALNKSYAFGKMQTLCHLAARLEKCKKEIGGTFLFVICGEGSHFGSFWRLSNIKMQQAIIFLLAQITFLALHCKQFTFTGLLIKTECDCAKCPGFFA